MLQLLLSIVCSSLSCHDAQLNFSANRGDNFQAFYFKKSFQVLHAPLIGDALLWTEEQIRQLIPDIDSRLDDSEVPTVVIKRDGSNIFLQFENRREIEFLIAQLSNLLLHQDELDLGVTVKGNVTTFGEYCSE